MRATLLLAFTAAFGIAIGTAHWRIADIGTSLQVQRARVNDTTSRLAAVESRPIPDVSGLAARVDACEVRLTDVKRVLDVLIREDRWPGRSALPRPVSEWKPWPRRGSALDPRWNRRTR